MGPSARSQRKVSRSAARFDAQETPIEELWNLSVIPAEMIRTDFEAISYSAQGVR